MATSFQVFLAGCLCLGSALRSAAQGTHEDYVRAERGWGGGPARSPDGRWEAFVSDHNLFVREVQSGETVQLSFDGSANYEYAQALASPVEMIRQGREDVDRPVRVRWAPDGRRLTTFRLDSRSARLLVSTPFHDTRL